MTGELEPSQNGTSARPRATASLSDVDGKVVGKAIRDAVRPILSEAGFTKFTDRKAWRPGELTVDHVSFRSFTSYIAHGVGCTTFSFAADVGVFYRCLGPDLEWPPEYHLTFRSALGKSIRQPVFHPYGRPEAIDRPDVWFVPTDGSDLDTIVQDAANVLSRHGLPFMDFYGDPVRAFDSLMKDRGYEADFDCASLWMPGNPDSPLWRDAALGIGHLIMDDPRSAMRVAPVLQS